MGPRRLGARTGPQSGAAGKAPARNAPHRGLLGAGQGQRHGNVRSGAGALFRTAARRVVSARSGAVRSRPIAWQELCDTIGGVYDIRPKAAGSKNTPATSNPCATATPTAANTSDPPAQKAGFENGGKPPEWSDRARSEAGFQGRRKTIGIPGPSLCPPKRRVSGAEENHRDPVRFCAPPHNGRSRTSLVTLLPLGS